jgi:RNA polymerase sigma factor (sigma-70 family)
MSDLDNLPAADTLTRHAAFMRGIALALTGDEHLADDAVQDAHVAALEARPGTIRNRRAWLGVVTRHLSLRVLRGRIRRRHREKLTARPESVQSAGDIAARLDLQRTVVDAVQELDEPYRLTVVLRFFDEMTPGEIARRQAIPVKTVHTRLRRALALLRGRLDRAHDGSRHRWMAPLLILAMPVSKSSALGAFTSVALGVVAMSLKTKLALGLSLAVAMFLAVWWLLPSSPDGLKTRARRFSAVADAHRAPPAIRSETDDRGEAGSESSIEGRVTDESGAPLSGVVVRIDGAESGGATDSTDESGHFRLVPVPAEAPVKASAPGRIPAVRRTRAGERVNLVLRAGGIVEGYLTRAGRGAPDALVRFVSYTSHRTAVARTDTAGHFVSPPLRRGRWSLEARPLTGAPVGVDLLWIGPGERLNLDLVVPDGRRLRGSVTDAKSGKPVAGATIRDAANPARRTRSSAEGKFELSGLSEARSSILVSARGYRTSWTRPTSPAPGGDLHCEARLVPGGRLSGRVLGPNGRGVAGARVGFLGRHAPPGGSLDWLQSDPTADAEVVTTRADGSFEIFGFSGGGGVLAVAKGYRPGGFQIRSTSVANLDALEIRLADGRRLTGHVRDAEGRGVEGARVAIRATPLRPGDAPWFRAGPVTTDARGRFALADLPTAPLELRVEANGYRRVVRWPVSCPRGEFAEAVVRLERVSGERGVVAGFARDARGRPWEGLRVRATHRESTRSLGSAWTDADGTFRIEGLPLGAVRLRATLGDGSEVLAETITRVGREDVVLAVESLGRLVGTVEDADGRPVPGCSLRIFPSGEPPFARYCPRVADAGGRFSVAILPGTWDVEARLCWRLAQRVQGVEVRSDSDSNPVRLVLKPGARLDGVVLGPDGEPVPQASVYLREKTGGVPLTLRADARGGFGFGPLQAGCYRLQVGSSRGGVESEIELAAGESRAMELVLKGR